MDIAELLSYRKIDPLWNTSYPLAPKDWEPFRVASPLYFKGESELSFYIHIPFCKQLCSFCEYTRMMCPDDETQKKYLTMDKESGETVERYDSYLKEYLSSQKSSSDGYILGVFMDRCFIPITNRESYQKIIEMI